MKKIIKISILVLLSLNLFVHSQNKKINNTAVRNKNKNSWIGGKYAPSTGVTRCLIVFAQFKNFDSTWYPDHPLWPVNNLPSWANDIIDNSVRKTYRIWTLSDYFSKMSNGTFNLIGDVYDSLVITNYDYAHYSNFGEVNSEIINKIKDKVKWDRYDNWSKVSEYIFKKNPDYKIDNVIIIYRSRPGNIFPFSGAAFLSYSGFIQVDPKHYIQMQFPSGYNLSGGGITMPDALSNGHHKTIILLAHEYGHFLFGEGHPQIVESRFDGGGYGLMGGLFSPCMNADEKRRLGWMDNIPNLQKGKTKINDYMTTNSAYKISISDDEYFLIENHQKISPYDMAGGFDHHPFPDTVGKGLYIFHMQNTNSNPQNIFYVPMCADGRWDWEIICSPPNPFDSTKKVNLYKRKSENASSGKNRMELYKVFADGAPCENLRASHFNAEALGYKEAPFNIGYKTLFAPWTNPGTFDKNHISHNFVLEIVSKSGNSFIVKFYPDASLYRKQKSKTN